MSSGSDISAARRFLAKALDRAQAAQLRATAEPVKLPLTPAQCPAFFEMRDLDDARQFRAELAAAERGGAIRVVPAKRKAPPNDVQAIVVVDIEALAARLGVDLRSVQVEQARERLSSYLDAFPVIDQVLERWGAGKTVRGTAPDEHAVPALLDAIRVRLARQGKADEVLLRRESSRLFHGSNGSKRIEQLSRWLDLLAEESLIPSGLARAEVFSALGLHKEPQPFLIAADAVVTGDEGESRLFRPYHGLPMAAITGFRFERPPSCVVSVENKATFHEMALLAVGTRACVVYSAGMPSPAWKRVYAKVLDAIDPGVPVYHFGDLDVGGFRIAQAVAEIGGRQRPLKPWLMDPSELTARGHRLDPVKPAQLVLMQRSCEGIGWSALAESLGNTPGLLEQEHIEPSLPRP